MNIQRQEIDPQILDSFFTSSEYINIKREEELITKKIDKDINNLIMLLKKSKKPIILL